MAAEIGMQLILCVCVYLWEREKRERETYWELCCMHAAGMKNEGGKDQLLGHENQSRNSFFF